MTKRSKRFMPIQRLAKHGENQAAQQLGRSKKALTEQEIRLQELVAYREEYAQQFHLTGQGGLDGRQLQSYQSFLNQLDIAIEQQKQKIIHAQQNCEERRVNWREKHTHSEVLNSAVKRIKVQEQKIEQRKEQRDNDEQAMRTRNTTTT